MPLEQPPLKLTASPYYGKAGEDKTPLTEQQIDYIWATLNFTGSVKLTIGYTSRLFKKNTETIRKALQPK